MYLPWLLIVLAYLFGAIPVGILVATRRGVNLREVGSGNIGATNVGRALGTQVGLLVGLADLLKGAAPVLWARPALQAAGLEGAWYFLAATGLAAVFGHCFPVYLKFRGGKGVSTAAGAILALDWRVGLIALGLWLFLLAVTRLVSLSSLLATLAVPVVFYLMPYQETVADVRLPWTAFGAALFLLILVRHWANLLRLVQGQESQIGQQQTGPTAAGVESGAEVDTEYR